MKTKSTVPLLAALLMLAPASAQAAPNVYAGGDSGTTIRQFDAVSGLLAPLTPATAGGVSSPVGIAVSNSGQNAYVADFGNGGVTQFDVNSDGTLSAKTPPELSARPGPWGVAVTPNGKNVYVSTTAAINQYSASASGALTAMTPADVSGGGDDIVVSPNGQNVYEADGFNFVRQYSIGAGGALAPLSPATVMAEFNPQGIAISPDGSSVYVTNRSSSGANVSQFDVGAGGKLTAKSPAAVAAETSPYGIAVSPDGKNAYVANNGSNTVSQFSVGAGGKLSPMSPATVGGVTSPRGVAVSADGKSVYVANNGSTTLSQFSVGAGGALSPKSPPAVTIGGAPNGVAVSPATSGSPPHGTKISSAKIDSKKGDATFKFAGAGNPTGFQCELAKKKPKAGFASCKSPKAYKGLKSGSYTFEVRGVNASGKDSSPAKKNFKIKRQ